MQTAQTAMTDRAPIGRRRKSRAALWVPLLVLCALLSACRHGVAARSEQVSSPDGVWLAVARTETPSWFAGKKRETTVYLERRKGRTDPVDSLWRRQPWLPVTIARLTHPAPPPIGESLVRLRWLTPTHLEVSYRGQARIDYRLPNCSGVHIFVQPMGAESRGAAR